MTEFLALLSNPDLSGLALLGLIILGTFVSEDLTCLTVSLLVSKGQLDLYLGITGCLVGIFIGDIGLYLVGRFLKRRILERPFLRRRLGAERMDRFLEKCDLLGVQCDRFGWTAVLASRFLPGTRIPIYVGAGVVGHKPGRFILWLFLAVLIWAPLVVFLGAKVGPAFIRPLELLFGRTWLAILVAAAAMFAVLRLVLRSATKFGRAKLIASISRIWRWEFWPVWLFQAPMVLVWAWLAIKYRGTTVWTAANPGIPDGGLVGESKFEILCRLDQRWVAPTIYIGRDRPDLRLEWLKAEIDSRGWSLPLVLKPDQSQRGEGFRVIRDWDQAAEYLASDPAAAVAQVYHPGPFEAGVFYYRFPGQSRGHIFSVTDKVFSKVVGDGRSSLRELIWHHPRFRMQAVRFETRHARRLDQVIPRGEEFQLALAGSHCQGTLFLDGARLITPRLRQRLDAIVFGHFEGFFFGRFDIRYADQERFTAGEDLFIVELNGVSSESTNIYDPKHSLLFAYATLARQYELMFRIGRANVDRGVVPGRPAQVLKNIFSFYRDRRTNLVSD